MSAAGLRSQYRQAVPTGTRQVYVSGSGSDSSAGTFAAPYRNLSKALSGAVAGDQIIALDAGPYAHTSVYQKAGNPGRWISIESANDSFQPLISVADNSGNDGLDIQASSFIGVFGFEVAGLQTSTSTNPSGITVYQGSHHVAIWNNLVHDFPGGGINCFYVAGGGWDLVDIFYNTIHATCRYSPNNTSGISVYGAQDLTGDLLGGYGYRLVGNYVYDVLCTVPYAPGGLNYVTDGNGISLDSLWVPNNLDTGLTPYSKRGLVLGNVVAACGGRGLHVFNTINVDDLFNTYIGSLRTTSPAITNGVETDAFYSPALAIANGVVHYGNLIVPLNTPNTTDGVSAYTNNVVLGGTQAVPSGNVDRRTLIAAYLAGNPTAAALLTGLPMSAFAPITPDLTASAAPLPAQALATGPRPSGSWAAGALEVPQPGRVLVHT